MAQKTITLTAAERTIIGKQVRQLRNKGSVPGIVYGHGVSPRAISVDERVLIKTFAEAGESSLIDLIIGTAAPVKVLIQEVQYHPLKNTITHADFREIRMTEKLEAEVPFVFTGEAPVVKALGGLLVRNMDGIKVRCLPNDLVHEIEISLTSLKNFGDSIKVSDIPALSGIEFLAKLDDNIIVVNEPISEAELAALDAKAEMDVSAVKVASEEKKAAAEAAAAEKDKE